MPEVLFSVRWPDGSTRRCYSPSTAIEEHLVGGAAYPVPELVRRAGAGLAAAAERVRAVRGFACTAAAEESATLRAEGARHQGLAVVERMWRPAEERRPAPALDAHRDVVVIGGGHAGLATSVALQARRIDHVVLERDVVASAWRRARWDSFTLVTPNWQCRLPGRAYDGPDPDGFMSRDEVVGFVTRYARDNAVPVREGVSVTSLGAGGDHPFGLETSAGPITADAVVLAVGGYHRPRIPAIGQRVPTSVTQLHSSGYRNPRSLPDGAVLVVGSGQSGAQIAEDLHLAGRRVHLAVGSAPRVARRYRGRDCVAWLADMGHYDMPIEKHPEGLGARQEANHYVTGRDGGRDIDLRAHAASGMRLHGRILDIDGGVARTAGDLAVNLDAADATSERIKDAIDEWIAANGVDAPAEPRYTPVWRPSGDGSGVLDLAAEDIRTIVWATGFRHDWSWVDLPAFDGTGYPTHRRGVTSVPGLYVLGLPWLHTWGSGRFAGIERDVEYVADQIAGVLGGASTGAAGRTATA